METRTAPLIGGRYRIGGLLGEGGMARVFDAFDERLERPAAVKILRAETRALPGMRQRFQQEALIAARLLHSRIVAVLDFGEDHTSSYLVMERLPGSTLRDEIVARGPLPPPRVMLVLHETLDALAAAHERGVLHRDIKPSNILLEQDGHTKITDFGIAKSFDIRTVPTPERDDMTLTGVVLGTPGYLAPERRAGHPATVQSDLYAVGAVMVEALTGERLGPGPPPTGRLPSPWREVAARAMATDPRDRFLSAGAMVQALRSPATAPRPTPRVPQPQPPATRTVQTSAARPDPVRGTALLAAAVRPGQQRTARARRRRRGRLLVGAVAVLALAGILFWLVGSAAQPTAPAVSTSKHHGRTQALTQPTQNPVDTESAAITALATALSSGGLPGDGALAGALQTTAAQPSGTAREASAQQTLSLAGVLLDGGGITSGQYRDVVQVLQPTGATTTTTVTTPTLPLPTQLFQGHGHGHDRGFGGGDQG